jgi:hypothetical protein
MTTRVLAEMGITSEIRQSLEDGCNASPPLCNMENVGIPVECDHFDS